MSRLSSVTLASERTPSPTLTKQRTQSTVSLVSLMRLKQQHRRSNVSLSEKSVSPRRSTSKHNSDQRGKARDIVVGVQQKSVKLIAIDFDNTFLSIHTGGYYQGTVESLLEHIRSTFYYLVQEVLDCAAFGHTLHLCIVSFSTQEQLIRKLLQLAFKTS